MTNSQPNAPRRKSMFSEMISIINSKTDRNGPLYSLIEKNEKGEVVELGVYNGTTKRYAVYASNELSNDAINDVKEVLGIS
jgi:hypothetical protein